MTEIIVAHEKHGTFTYSSAMTILRQRVEDGYYYNYDEGDPETQFEDRAKAIAAMDRDREGEAVAWRFLQERSDHEYESVEKQSVR